MLVYHKPSKKFRDISLSACEEYLDFSYLSELEFASSKILMSIERKCEKRLRTKDNRQMNRWTRALYEKSMAKGDLLNSIAIAWVSSYVGLGVFARKEIPYLTYISEYTGVVRKRKRKDSCNPYAFRYVTGPKETPFVIDASHKGNFTRFLNHSDEPNLTSRWMIAQDGITHIIFFANRFISKGEQLTYDYGPYYWRRRFMPALL